jgi:hypothetical protein
MISVDYCIIEKRLNQASRANQEKSQLSHEWAHYCEGVADMLSSIQDDAPIKARLLLKADVLSSRLHP